MGVNFSLLVFSLNFTILIFYRANVASKESKVIDFRSQAGR